MKESCLKELVLLCKLYFSFRFMSPLHIQEIRTLAEVILAERIVRSGVLITEIITIIVHGH